MAIFIIFLYFNSTLDVTIWHLQTLMTFKVDARAEMVEDT